MTLENCAMCGSEARHSGGFAECTNEACYVIGPSNDRQGKRWNHMQRCIRVGRRAELREALRGDSPSPSNGGAA